MDGPVNEPDSETAALTPKARAQLSLINIGSSSTRVETWLTSTKATIRPVDCFPEVPLEVVEATGWQDVASRRLGRHDENSCLRESRALTRGVEILASFRQLYQSGQHVRGPQF